MASTFHENSDAQNRASVVFVLPTAAGRRWAFTVPRALARCVGAYARIPEFATAGALLVVEAIVDEGHGS